MNSSLTHPAHLNSSELIIRAHLNSVGFVSTHLTHEVKQKKPLKGMNAYPKLSREVPPEAQNAPKSAPGGPPGGPKGTSGDPRGPPGKRNPPATRPTAEMLIIAESSSPERDPAWSPGDFTLAPAPAPLVLSNSTFLEKASLYQCPHKPARLAPLASSGSADSRGLRPQPPTPRK